MKYGVGIGFYTLTSWMIWYEQVSHVANCMTHKENLFLCMKITSVSLASVCSPGSTLFTAHSNLAANRGLRN